MSRLGRMRGLGSFGAIWLASQFHPVKTKARWLFGITIVLSFCSQASLADGLNTGFDDSYWKKVRAAKGIPSTPQGVDAAHGTVLQGGAGRTERQLRSGRRSREIAQSSPEVCAQMAQTLIDSPCVFIQVCLIPMGRCSSEQSACRTEECVRGQNGGGSPEPHASPTSGADHTGGAQLPGYGLREEAGRVMGQRTVAYRPTAAHRTAWVARTSASKIQRVNEHVAWVRNVEHRPINFTVDQLVQTCDQIAAEAQAASYTVEQEARRMIMHTSDPNVALTDPARRDWTALADKAGRAAAHLGWVHDSDHRATSFSAADLVAAANRISQGSAGSGGEQGRLSDEQRNQLWHCAGEMNMNFYHSHSRLVPNESQIRNHITTCAETRRWQVSSADFAAILPNVVNELPLLSHTTNPEGAHDQLTADQRNQLWHCASEANLSFYHAHSRTVPTDPQIRDHITRCASSRGWRLVEADFAVIMPPVTNELRLLRLTNPEVPHSQLTGGQRNQLWHCAAEMNMRFYHRNSRTTPNETQIRGHISACAQSRGWQVSPEDFAAILPNVNNELGLLPLTTNPD